MEQAKRYHPFSILYDLWGLLKTAFFFAVYLFVFNYDSESVIVIYGRLVFYLVITITFFSLIYKWFFRKFLLGDGAFYLYRGLFNTSERTIAFSKIHNVQRHTSVFHRIFRVTSITFETSMTGSDAAIRFEVVSHKEAERLEFIVKSGNTDEIEADIDDLTSQADRVVPAANRRIHFTPTKKDVLKASFTSLSFLLLIPLIGSLYFRIDDIFQVEDKAEGFFMTAISTWWVITIIIVVFLLASVGFGIVRAFLKYGKYKISSDDERIYITKGVVDETAFSISKNKVQAIEITQSMMKRILGLAEVKLISAGSLGENDLETSSLYPFLPVDRAYEMIAEILPSYNVTRVMERLPRKSLWIRMFRPSWIWVISSVALFYFKPPVFGVNQAWWMISASLFVVIIVLRLLDFNNTRHVLNDAFIQFKTGSIETSLFVSKRDKVVEVSVSRNILQQLLGLASIGMVNRAKPIHHTGIKDVPIDVADSFYTWYVGRKEEIEIE